MKPEFKDKSIRSFVIRGGRMTEAQEKAFNHSWPSYGLSLYDGLIDPQTTFGRKAPLVIEVGFGMGDSLLEMACDEPDKDFIGIEVHPPGVGRLINEAHKRNLSNLKVYMADANDVLNDCIPSNCAERFQLYFPDPWHKKKHTKRRIVQDPFIAAVHGVLQIGGVFHLATDWQHYADYMMEKMSLTPEFENVAGEYLFSPRPDYRPVTKFEKRGNRLGHGVWDLLFSKSITHADLSSGS
jgi:tRNA (guanine-N7-)-methyltransferase